MAALKLTSARDGEGSNTLTFDFDLRTAGQRASYLRQKKAEFERKTEPKVSPWVSLRDSGGGEVCRVHVGWLKQIEVVPDEAPPEDCRKSAAAGEA